MICYQSMEGGERFKSSVMLGRFDEGSLSGSLRESNGKLQWMKLSATMSEIKSYNEWN